MMRWLCGFSTAVLAESRGTFVVILFVSVLMYLASLHSNAPPVVETPRTKLFGGFAAWVGP